jgi:hypothetical protein
LAGDAEARRRRLELTRDRLPQDNPKIRSVAGHARAFLPAGGTVTVVVGTGASTVRSSSHWSCSVAASWALGKPVEATSPKPVVFARRGSFLVDVILVSASGVSNPPDARDGKN